ncbi:lipase 3-like [Wyeomyia smithii]|uniref:lipase 3-like n=1 Tax=Wyeomyia smithii TaxID=174621 RepID=UPI002467BBA3|nr:lipase 3-like [Wyeomyia smithii]
MLWKTAIVGFTLYSVVIEAFVVQKDFQVQSSDAKLTTLQLAARYGYRVEAHEVETDDGYQLEVHRITGSGSTLYDKRLPPVFLMHGLLASSADWLLIGAGNALAYQLSDLGYDVWLGNARGNRYSRKHKKYTPNMDRFWNFSWHEIGVYDVPAMIDCVLNVTGKEKLHYLGHSQGSTTFFVMASIRPEFNDKIILMQALAPVAYMDYVKSPLLSYFVRHMGVISTIIELFGLAEFKPISRVTLELAKLVCPSSQVNTLCTNILFLLAGADPEQVDPRIIPILLGHIPAGSSTRQLMHYGQEMLSGQFRQYDHGKIKNCFVYGRAEPPVYNLTDVTAPVALHYGANDYLAQEGDVQRLAKELPNLVECFRIESDAFNHMDFLIAKDVNKLLYDRLISNIEKYSNEED